MLQLCHKDSNQILQDPDPEAESTSSAARASCKRARSATVVGDDEAAIGGVAPILLRKRRKTCDASTLQTPTPSSPPEQAGKARSDLSPATEAAIQQMPQAIKETIKTLKWISKCVEGLLEFKAILDFKQLEIDQMLEAIERQGPQCNISMNQSPGHG